MSLLDGVESIDVGAPKANYLGGGRTLMKLSRLFFEEANGIKVPKTRFQFSGKVLHSTNPGNTVGETRTANVKFDKFPENALQNMVRILLGIAANSETPLTQKDLNKPKVLELTGEKQPLTGTIIAVEGKTTYSDKRKSASNPDGAFTTYEVVKVDDQDLQTLAEIGAI